MIITTRRQEDVTIVELDGMLTRGTGDAQLREAIAGLLRAGVRKILLNMKKIRMMDSSGLGELVQSKSAAARTGATIKLLHVEDKVRQVLEPAGLISVFEVYDNMIDAIASFSR